MNYNKAPENETSQTTEQVVTEWDDVAKLANKMDEVTNNVRGVDDDLGENDRTNKEEQKSVDEPMHNMSIEKFAKELGLSKVSLYERIKSLKDFEMKKERIEGSRVAKFVVTPEQQQQLKELVGVPPPPGYISVEVFSTTYGIAAQTIRDHIPKDDLTMFREEGEKRKKQYLSEKQQKNLLDLFRIAPEDYMLIDDFAAQIGVNERFVRQRIPENQIEKFKDPESNQSRIYLSQKLRDSLLLTLRPPDDYEKLTTFLRENGLKKSDESVSSVISGLSIDRFMGKDDSRPIDYVSPEQQECILKSVQPPEGYMSYDEFAQQENIESTRLLDYIADLGMKEEIKKYRADNDSRKRYYLSPNQQKRIKEARGGRPPGGFKTPEELAEMMGVSTTNVWRRIRELGYDQKENSFISNNNYKKFYLSPKQQGELWEIVGIEPPDGYIALGVFARQINYNETSIRDFIPKSERFRYKGKNDTMPKDYLSPEQQADVIEQAEKTNSGTSIPENTIAFYLIQSGQTIEQGRRPGWLKNPDTGRNMEVDIFINPPGVGIEYDGCYYHQDANRDIKKNKLAMLHGYRIIHVREKGCPELLDGSICIERKKNNDDFDLAECIKQCFQLLGIPEPDIDIKRDKKAILEFIDERMAQGIKTGEELEDTSPAA